MELFVTDLDGTLINSKREVPKRSLEILNKLIEKGVSEKEILLITYTTKGVEELKEKISYWLKFYGLTQKAEDFIIFTFNSFGYELIKKEY